MILVMQNLHHIPTHVFEFTTPLHRQSSLVVGATSVAGIKRTARDHKLVV